MNDLQVVTIGEVKAAFETLLEVVGRECDWATAHVVHWAREDVLSILAGEWGGVVEGCDGGEVDEVDGVVDGVRCPGCHQSIRDVAMVKFACPECYVTFGDEAVEAAIRPF